MVSFNQLKALGNDLIGKAAPLAAQAKEKAGPLAAQAKEKAGPLAAQAKEKATPLVGKAKDAAAKGVDRAADKVDSATGGKYSGKIGSVSDRLGTKGQASTSPFDAPPVTVTDPLHTDGLHTALLHTDATRTDPLHTDPLTSAVSTDATYAGNPIRDEIIEPYPPTLPPAPGSTI